MFSTLDSDSHIWTILENRKVDLEILEILLDILPSKALKIAYLLTPGKELVFEEKPEWSNEFETVFYDSLWDFLDEKKPLWEAYNKAASTIGGMISRLYYYLDNQMLVNVDYADFLNIIRGGNVGILRSLNSINFDWHWGIWERGLITILAGNDMPLEDVISILKKFQEVLKEKDIIWGIMSDNRAKNIEVLALLVRKW